MKDTMRTVLFAILAAAASLAPAFAQATDANIVGTVTDASGAALAGANVEAQNAATGVRTTTTTSTAGQYRFNNVPVGTYNITVSATGFNTVKVTNVVATLNRTATADATLAVAGVSTTVDVTEAPPQVDTTSAQVQSTYETRQAIELPTASNPAGGVLNLSLLSAGVSSSGGVGVGTGPSVGGQRPRNNNYQIEGVDNNRKDVTGPTVSVSNEAVGEFTVLQNQFSAEYGHSSGGQFNTILRSGTNEFHGSIYDYVQNRNLNAVDVAFARQGITENPRYDQNRLGATAGGPIIKNKWFYFGNYEYNPIGQASTPSSQTYAPTAAGYTTLGGLSGISKTNLQVLQTYLPAAPAQTGTTTVAGTTIPIGILPITAPNFTNTYNWLASSDYNISERDQLRGRYVDNRIDSINTAANLPAFFSPLPTRARLATIAEYHTFSPNITNELRLNYSRFTQDLPVGSFNFPGLDVFPNLQISQDLNAQIGPDPNGPQSTITNTYQLVDNVNWTFGKHTFKFGFDGRKLIAPQVFVQRQRGDYEYSSLDRYLRDLVPNELAERNVGASPYSGDQFALYGYVNDNWRATPSLTLNLGVRYEYNTVPYSMRLQTLNTISNVPGVISFDEPRPQKTNFAPRIGIAYSPGGRQTTSIRAGFSMAYDSFFDNIGLLSYPPQFQQTVDFPVSDTPGFLANGGILPNKRPTGTAEDARAGTSSWIPRDTKLPYSVNWTVGVQQAFRKDYSIEVRYLGTRGVHLLGQNRINAAAVVQPDHQIPTFLNAPSASQLAGLPLTLGQLRAEANAANNTLANYGFENYITSFLPNGNSTYHGLAVELTKRFSANWMFKGSYTWSHNIDDSTAEVFSTVVSPRRPQDFFNMRAERANSALDRRHRFTYTSIYDARWFSGANWMMRNLVGNWTMSGTYTYESPEYATVQSGIDSNLNGDTAGDRSIINPGGTSDVGSGSYGVNRQGQRVPSGDPGIVAYVANDPSARYIVAQLGSYPNAGRNTLALKPINNVDASLSKNFNLTERVRFTLRGDAYNLFNHPQFIPGNINNVNARSRTATRTFVIPGNAAFNRLDTAFESNARVIQVVGRITW